MRITFFVLPSSSSINPHSLKISYFLSSYPLPNRINILFILLFAFFFLGLHPGHMKVPRLGVELELQLPAYTIAAATQDLSCVCDVNHSSQQCRTTVETPILLLMSFWRCFCYINLLKEILMVKKSK